MRKLIILAILATVLGSCAVKYERPQIETDNLYRNGSAEDTLFDVAKIDWKDFYKDTLLCKLIDSALANNYDMEIAYKRIEQQRSYFKKSKWSLAPTASASANASYGKADLANPQSPYFSVGISASWEIDIWGKLTKAKRAQFQQLLAQENTRNAIQTELIATIAKYYFQLIALDAQKGFILETITNRENYLATVKEMKESAQVNEVAVLQAQSQLLTAQTYIPTINQTISEIENNICYLIGEAPGPIQRRAVSKLSEINFPKAFTGIPANLLRNRPDIIAAENTLQSKLHSYNSAVAAMYPSLTLSGNISTDATQINQWFNLPSSLIWSVVGGLTQPIFNGRALRTQKEVAKKDYEIAIIEFKESILNAGMEVSNTLSALNNNSEKADLLYKQFTVLDKAYEYSYLLFVNGYATYLDVLTAQEGVFDAQLSYIQCLNDVINNHIDLYRALGGGWNKPENNNKK